MDLAPHSSPFQPVVSPAPSFATPALQLSQTLIWNPGTTMHSPGKLAEEFLPRHASGEDSEAQRRNGGAHGWWWVNSSRVVVT